MNISNFPSIDNMPLSDSDNDLIGKLTASNADSTDQTALRAALGMLLKQRNILAYQVSELEDKAITVQIELEQKATTLQTQLDQANAVVELQYRASLANADMRAQLQQEGSI